MTEDYVAAVDQYNRAVEEQYGYGGDPYVDEGYDYYGGQGGYDGYNGGQGGYDGYYGGQGYDGFVDDLGYYP